MAFPPVNMAESGLNAALLQAGALVATAGAVTRFEGSRRRAGGASSPDLISKLFDLLEAQLRYFNLQFSVPENEIPDEARQFMLFFGATSVKTLLYELEHELLSTRANDALVQIIEQLDPLKLAWNRLLHDENGELDTWFIEYSFAAMANLRNLYLRSRS